MNRINENGFTLIELLLAMTIFIGIMMIATLGFVGMARTVQRGLVHKQLSEAIQLGTDNITKAMRGAGSAIPLRCPANDLTTAGCFDPTTPGVGVPYERLCFGSGGRFLWPPTGSPSGGLQEDGLDCNKQVTTQTTTIMGDTYQVRRLEAQSTNVSNLRTIDGVFSTANDNAFDWDTAVSPVVPDPATMQCKGTAASNGLSETCAVERFQFIVNIRTN